MLYYLNDGYKGGETAFPLADNVTLDLSVRRIVLVYLYDFPNYQDKLI